MLKLEIKTPGFIFQLPKSGHVVRTPFNICIPDEDLKLYETIIKAKVPITDFKVTRYEQKLYKPIKNKKSKFKSKKSDMQISMKIKK